MSHRAMPAEAQDYARRASLKILREMTLEQGLAEFMALCGDLSTHLEQTEHLFRQARMDSMRSLQRRLLDGAGEHRGGGLAEHR